MAQVCFPGKSMDKKDWYKLLAVGIVLIFVIEGIAIGILQDDTPSSGGSGTATESLTGTVNTNVTIVRYEPYVIVGGGNQDEVENAKQRLIESGAATYAVPKDENLVVSLRSGKDAPTAAMEFEKANATVLATAMISTPSRLRVDAQDISTTVDGTSFNIQLRPIFDEGSVAAPPLWQWWKTGFFLSLGISSFFLLTFRGQLRKRSWLPKRRLTSALKSPGKTGVRQSPLQLPKERPTRKSPT